MTAALLRALGDLGDSRILATALAVALWTAGVFAAALAAALAALGAVDPGSWAPGWAWEARLLAGALAFAAAIASASLGFVVVAHGVAGFFLERVVARVELLHYPHLPAAGAGGAAPLAAAARFALLVAAANALAAPLYLAGLLLPPAGVALFYGLNGWLVGREYAEAVAARRLAPAEAARWRRSRRLPLLLAGAAIAFAMTVPVVNLVAPVAAAAFMTHLFHGPLAPGPPRGGRAEAVCAPPAAGR